MRAIILLALLACGCVFNTQCFLDTRPRVSADAAPSVDDEDAGAPIVIITRR